VGVIISQLWRSRSFRLGLALRILAVLFCAPWVQEYWFVPFMRHLVAHPSMDPWRSFLAAGGDSMSFPYGPMMALYHLPFVAIGVLAQRLTGYARAVQIGFSCSLLTADFLLLTALCRLNSKHVKELVRYYWLSPIVLYVTFWHGQTDVIFMLDIVVTLLLLRERRYCLAGAASALAIATKLSAIIPLPFVLIFLWKSRGDRKGLARYAATCAILTTLAHIPFVLSQGFRQMVFGSPEIARIYDVSIHLTGGVDIYIVPVIYMLLLYWAWQMGRMNFEMLFAFLGVSYFLILLATPAAVGWYLWCVPFLAVYQIASGRIPHIMVASFSSLLVGVKALTCTGASIPALRIDWRLPLVTHAGAESSERMISLALTILMALGLLICVTTVQRALLNNDFYRLSRRPLLIGIAGDSGTGKDTLSLVLLGLFGEHSVATVSGDDYHRFERSSPMWQMLTHLNPRASDLDAFSSDCLALLEGRRLLFRRYNHSTGRFSPRQTQSAKDVILVSGLHALYPENLRSRMDLRIYLEMDEELRQCLKVRRDVLQRGHTLEKVRASIASRLPDAERYIHPQREFADIVLTLQAENAEALKDVNSIAPLPLRLKITLRMALHLDELARMLNSACCMSAEISMSSNIAETVLTVEGEEVSAEDIQAVAERLVPHLEELLDDKPQWRPGVNGVIQIVVLMLIAERAKSRR